MTLLQTTNDLLVNEGNIELVKILNKFLSRFFIDIISTFILIRFVYFRLYKRSELFFTFFIFNIVIFLICFLLNKVDLSMGAAFGLFAVFSMLRYRTEDISIKDMSYLFLVIAIGLISAVTKIKGAPDSYEYLFMGLINLIIILVTFVTDSNLFFKKETVQIINYEKIELIKPEKNTELLEDIRSRTGLNAHRITVTKIDLLKNSAQIKVYFYEV